METLNDADGWLVNVWRLLQLSPAETAAHCSGPVSEIDYHARLVWLQERRTPELVSWLEGDPRTTTQRLPGGGYTSPRVASVTLGRWTLASDRRTPDEGRGIHRVNRKLGDAGRESIADSRTLATRARESIANSRTFGNAGQGIHRELPFLGNAGQEPLLHYLHNSSIASPEQHLLRPWERVLKPSVLRAKSGWRRHTGSPAGPAVCHIRRPIRTHRARHQ